MYKVVRDYMAIPCANLNRYLDLFTNAPRLLPRVADAVVLASPDLCLPLVNDVFDEYLTRILSLELADPARVPEFTCNAKVFAAADECVGTAAFCCGWDSVGGEVVLFTTGHGDETAKVVRFGFEYRYTSEQCMVYRHGLPSVTNESILSRHSLRSNDTLTTGHKTPSTRPEGAVQDPAVLDLGQIENTIGLDLDFLGIGLGQQDIGCFLGEWSSRETVERACPINLLFGGSLEQERLIGQAALRDVFCCWAVWGRGRRAGCGACWCWRGGLRGWSCCRGFVCGGSGLCVLFLGVAVADCPFGHRGGDLSDLEAGDSSRTGHRRGMLKRLNCPP